MWPLTSRVRFADVAVTFPAAPEQVYAYLTDPTNRPQWQSSLRSVAQLTIPEGRPGEVGTAWVDDTWVPGVSPRMEVVDAVPEERWREIGQWGPVDAALELFFRPGATGTEVRARAWLTVPVIVAPVVRALATPMSLALRADLGAAGERISSSA